MQGSSLLNKLVIDRASNINIRQNQGTECWIDDQSVRLVVIVSLLAWHIGLHRANWFYRYIIISTLQFLLNEEYNGSSPYQWCCGAINIVKVDVFYASL